MLLNITATLIQFSKQQSSPGELLPGCGGAMRGHTETLGFSLKPALTQRQPLTQKRQNHSPSSQRLGSRSCAEDKGELQFALLPWRCQKAPGMGLSHLPKAHLSAWALASRWNCILRWVWGDICLVLFTCCLHFTCWILNSSFKACLVLSTDDFER